jgi:hypothetical protein
MTLKQSTLHTTITFHELKYYSIVLNFARTYNCTLTYRNHFFGVKIDFPPSDQKNPKNDSGTYKYYFFKCCLGNQSESVGISRNQSESVGLGREKWGKNITGT